MSNSLVLYSAEEHFDLVRYMANPRRPEWLNTAERLAYIQPIQYPHSVYLAGYDALAVWDAVQGLSAEYGAQRQKILMTAFEEVED